MPLEVHCKLMEKYERRQTLAFQSKQKTVTHPQEFLPCLFDFIPLFSLIIHTFCGDMPD